jgi:hypothetical protein
MKSLASLVHLLAETSKCLETGPEEAALLLLLLLRSVLAGEASYGAALLARAGWRQQHNSAGQQQ